MKNFHNFDIFRKDDFDSLNISICWPGVYLFDDSYTGFESDEDKQTGLSLPTKLMFVKGNISWHFTVRILGFGFTLNRQWTY